MAAYNDNPLQFRYTTEGTQMYGIDSKTDTLMEMSQVITSQHGLNVYLGAILSADRETIYWINDTEPLPN